MLTHDYRLFFIHIPKCAGRSICDLFNQRFDHFTALYYITDYEVKWQQYNKFTIVRNPYDRLVSIYHYIKQHRRHQHEAIAKAGSDFKSWLMANVNFYGPVHPALFHGEGLRGTDGYTGSPFWFSAQSERLLNSCGSICQDIDILKFEDGSNAISQYLFDKTKIWFTLPHENKSKHDHYSTYYDNELLQFLNCRYAPIAQDCNSFGYTYARKVEDLV